MNSASPDKTLIVKQKNNQLIQLMKTGQLLTLNPACAAGLIVQKRYHADFMGPGAAVGGVFDLECTGVYPLGDVEFSAPSSCKERQQAYLQRIGYIERIQQITQIESPLRRAVSIVSDLCHSHGVEAVENIPSKVLAQLVAVLPETIEIAWQHYIQNPELDGEDLLELTLRKVA